MSRFRIARAAAALLALTLLGAACGGDDDGDAASRDDSPMEQPAAPAAPADSAGICDADGLVDAVESGPDEGTLAGMTDDPVATAASSNPVLTTLVGAVGEAGLVDTLNSAPALTVFCLLYTSPSPRDRQKSRMPSSA